MFIGPAAFATGSVLYLDRGASLSTAVRKGGTGMFRWPNRVGWGIMRQPDLAEPFCWAHVEIELFGGVGGAGC
ncbi:hypothetical protein BMJ32_03225 [Sinorhizobium medicae]|jgi:hypothetical protein|uniref:Uncharacterized protein n=1 Tax=Sinorhizobium medicae TaxID=110321 RepID=A0A508WT57_9HYPH|nr:hypothetical protein BMJ34_30400 [Sinorhizobium medicae]PLT89725.1 hypothetical protein BMJ35_12895 [Sinorhizobium medicae]PLT97815.1 hypothetical protein BMJ33_25025 [Sinorhizobium medicae]PLU06894.1 hypothetical protein BMJ32_03225 [Sinorhizobium medicae]PLU15340.1 hypothetical protein BMJ30_19145 [Sinorhizobium medicae]